MYLLPSYTMYRRFGCSRSIGRERSERRVATDAFSESSVNLSKIFDLVNFKDIEALPARELAYTANLASRAGITNEAFWERIKTAFVQDARMNGKLTSQIFLAIDKANQNNEKLTALCLSRVTRRIHCFSATDLILILHAVSNKKGGIFSLEAIANKLAQSLVGDVSLSPRLTAVLFASVAKLGIEHPLLTSRLLALSELHKSEFNQFELAAVLRAMSKTGNRSVTVIEAIVWSEISDPSSFSIIMHACRNILLPSDVLDAIFENLPRHVSNTDLRPYLFLHAVGLAKTPHQVNVCVNLATNLLRNFKQIKALSMPIVLEGLRGLDPSHTDVPILLEEGTRLTESVIDRYLLVTTHQDRVALLDGKQATIYSPWFRAKLVESLNSVDTCLEGEVVASIQRFIYQRSGDIAEVMSRIESSEMNEEICEAVMQLLWVVKDPNTCSKLLQILAVNPTGKRSDQFYSLLFRFLARRPDLMETGQAILKSVDLRVCSHKTLCRLIQICPSDLIMSTAIDRVDEIEALDILGFLNLIKNSLESDRRSAHLEGQLVRKMGQLKSLETRGRIVQRGKAVGLDLTEIVDNIESELATRTIA